MKNMKKKLINFFNNFYMWGKKINIIPEIKSQDKFNRQKAPAGTKFQKLENNTNDKKYIKEAAKWVNKNFPNNYGNTDNFIYPISHSTANKWLNNFIKKLSNFEYIPRLY